MNDTTTISVPARDLLRMLKVVSAHAGDDDTLPSLNAVKIEVRGPVLWLAATDRFTIGTARLRIPGAKADPVPDIDVILPADAARSMIKALAGRYHDVVAIRFGKAKLTLLDGQGELGTWVHGKNWEFVSWRPMLAKLLAVPAADLGVRFALEARHLAKFTACDRGENDEELPMLFRVVTLGPNSRTVLVTAGEWFLGAAMPITMDANGGHKALLAADNWADWTTALTGHEPTTLKLPEPAVAEA